MSRYQQHQRRDAALEVATQAEADAIVARLGEAGIRATTFSAGLGASGVALDWAQGVKVIVAPEDRAAALALLDDGQDEGGASSRSG